MRPFVVLRITVFEVRNEISHMQLPLCLIKHYAVKTHRTVKTLRCTDRGARCKRLMNQSARLLYPLGVPEAEIDFVFEAWLSRRHMPRAGRPSLCIAGHVRNLLVSCASPLVVCAEVSALLTVRQTVFVFDVYFIHTSHLRLAYGQTDKED